MHFNVAQERNPIIAPGKRVNDGQEEKRQPRNPCKKINRRPNSSVAQLEKDRAFRLAMFTNRVHLDPKPAIVRDALFLGTYPSATITDELTQPREDRHRADVQHPFDSFNPSLEPVSDQSKPPGALG